MSHFAAAAVRDAVGWSAAELDLTGAADVEDVVDRLRDVNPNATVSLLFVEVEDTYLVVLRLDDGEDLRAFGSDAALIDDSRIGALLLGDIKEPVIGDPDPAAATGIDDDAVVDASDDADDEPVPTPDVDPIGDPDLLADLGVSAARLLALCGRDGMLPADVTAELCQLVGCGDEMEELREV